MMEVHACSSSHILRCCSQVAITAYQPVDTVVKTVEVPVVRTVETYVPKVVVEEKIVEVPKFVPEYVEKVIVKTLRVPFYGRCVLT